MKALKPIYKTLRSIIISLILLMVIVYVVFYVLLSVPTVQNEVKKVACRELSVLLGGKLDIRHLSVSPFSEVLLYDVSLSSPNGTKCADIKKVAAGIDLWCLVAEGRIILNYAEVIGLTANINQKEKDGPLNIKFLIDALSPKDKTKPPTKFDLRFRNIVIRDSKALFSRPWMMDENGKPQPFAEVSLQHLRLDLSIPTLKNDLFRFDIRNMQCDISPGIELRGLSAYVSYKRNKTGDEFQVKGLKIDLPHTRLEFGDIAITTDDKKPISTTIDGSVTPSDFVDLAPALSAFDTPWDIILRASLSEEYVGIENFKLENDLANSYISLKGNADGFSRKDSLNLEIEYLKGSISSGITRMLSETLPGLDNKVKEILQNAGDISLDIKGCLANSDYASIKGSIFTDAGEMLLEANANSIKSKKICLTAGLTADMELGRLLGQNALGYISLKLDADIKGIDKNAEGEINLNLETIEIHDQVYDNIAFHATKNGRELFATINADDDNLNLDMEADCIIDGINSSLDAYIDLSGLNTAILGAKGKFADSVVSFNLDAHTVGDNIDNILGFLHLSDFNVHNGNDRNLTLSNLSLNIDSIPRIDANDTTLHERHLKLRSDWLDADIRGSIHPTSIVKEAKEMVSVIFPSLIESNDHLMTSTNQHNFNNFTFDFNIKGKSDLYDFLNAPVCPLTEIPVKGYFDSKSGKFKLSVATPHLRQGKNKLIRDTSLNVDLNSFIGMAKVEAATIFPAKKGDVQLVLDVSGLYDILTANVQLNPTFDSSLKGSVALESRFAKIPNPITQRDELSIHVDILPSAVSMKETVWNIANGRIDYAGKNISVSNFLVQHDNQYVKIDGIASENPDDYLSVKLNDIDLDYIFSILNINYVTFGGMATGEVVGSQLLTKTPSAHTKYLRVKNLSYNDAVLGDGNLASSYFPDQQKVGIYAVINDPLTRERRANIDGGIWVTRDSLSFDFDANKVNLQFMKPFVSAFCPDLKGLGSGKCKLFGTFSDIDLVGGLRADTISMKIDFTNTWYHAGNDSVYMGHGLIKVNPLTLYDSEGHTAELSGWLKHRYFHEPVFNFKIRDAKSILCYDTNETLNPLWYGTIYGSGDAQIAGRPGLVEIDMNMETEPNSKFFYVISDAEETDSYAFLSFTDRRKEKLLEQSKNTVPDYLHEFIKKNNAADEGSSNVVLSLKGTVTNDTEVTLIMDPIAGDKITARGQGALQMDYNMAANDLRMIGTYTLDEGKYFFTLQDIIIKNFNIKEGSKIQFNGDPMDANLDITATYRVNTNLTDLDKTFSSDKELNRTNVPVDAILLVKGPMTHPDIDFDIDLPTLTSDVERKVKSIVSTNDMMSRQIIYLLALNRFYTPEYTGGTSNTSGELSSVASSTLSSQLSNILSNMTDKLSVAPSFRSDNGKFTDMEFDLALSSRLLNNRLLINGNFGYRDKETSNTQFVGDFDIEYLLNRSGNLRLKAYNHFNDQNYYLRSALTTQGVGVVFRKDFDHLFNFRRRKYYQPADTIQQDSISKEAKP